jgi:cation diffusion facilitator family transporter
MQALLSSTGSGQLCADPRRAGAHRSPALQADGHHILSDVVTSVGVIFGLGLALAFDQPRLDPLLALIVAINVLWQGWKVIASSVDGLMDRAIDPVDEQRIHEIIKAEAHGAIEAHDIRTRMAGRASFVEFHLVVDGDMSVEESHPSATGWRRRFAPRSKASG